MSLHDATAKDYDPRAARAEARDFHGELKDFVKDGKGNVVPKNQYNVRLALDRLGVRLANNVFANRLLADERPVDDATRDRLWLAVDERFGFLPGRDFFEAVMLDAARQKPFHPVRNYLDALRWDGTPRLDRWLVRYGSAVETEYVRAVGRLFLIAAVRRVRKPGCKFDELLILESDQGLDKSGALRVLCPEGEWFSDSMPLGADSKVVIERTAGVWIVEAADLAGRGKSDIDQLKAALSRQVDGPVRLAYGRLPVTVPRQFVIAGTTNGSEYLRDLTGNRRFWPVRVKRFDVAELRRDRDQIWAEAAQREAAEESIRLDPNLWPRAAHEQDQRRVVDPWEDALAPWLASEDKVQAAAVWNTLNVPVERRRQEDNERLGSVMKRLGFKRTTARFDKKVQRAYVRVGLLDVLEELDE